MVRKIIHIDRERGGTVKCFRGWRFRQPLVSVSSRSPVSRPDTLCFSGEGILRGIGQAPGLVVCDVPHAQELHDLIERLSVVSESHGPVVGIALLNQHMTVEPAHLGNGKYADAAETPGLDRQDPALGDVGAENAVAAALKAVEGDVAGGNVALQGAAGEVRFTAVVARMIFNLQMIYDPERIVIGGGISRQRSLLEYIQKNLDFSHQMLGLDMPKAEVTACKFFNEANLLGAYANFLNTRLYIRCFSDTMEKTIAHRIRGTHQTRNTEKT